MWVQLSSCSRPAGDRQRGKFQHRNTNNYKIHGTTGYAPTIHGRSFNYKIKSKKKTLTLLANSPTCSTFPKYQSSTMTHYIPYSPIQIYELRHSMQEASSYVRRYLPIFSGKKATNQYSKTYFPDIQILCPDLAINLSNLYTCGHQCRQTTTQNI